MAMCSKCKALYDSYAAILGNLSTAADQCGECSSQATATKSAFSAQFICGESLDKDDADNIISDLGTISENLSTMIGQCQSEMNRIEAACPGPTHYQNTRLNSSNL